MQERSFTPTLKPKEIAALERLSPDAIYRAIQSGDLPARKVCGRLRVDRVDCYDALLSWWWPHTRHGGRSETPCVRGGRVPNPFTDGQTVGEQAVETVVNGAEPTPTASGGEAA